MRVPNKVLVLVLVSVLGVLDLVLVLVLFLVVLVLVFVFVFVLVIGRPVPTIELLPRRRRKNRSQRLRDYRACRDEKLLITGILG
jgi:hypothetical protein